MNEAKHPTDGPAPWLFESGRTIDHYRVLRPVGRGGMAEVYLARDTRLGRRVALKVIRAGALGDAGAVERFLFEARTTARFSHPHIVAIHDVGETGGTPYVALEYLEGRTLRELLAQERSSPREAIRVCLAIAQALEEAHGRGVLHRDLKPENVMLPQDGRLRVLDFGLARSVRVQDPRPRSAPSTAADDGDVGSQPTWVLATEPEDLFRSVAERFETRGEAVQGTPAYMAPEQWEEVPATAAVDVWALGLILYELCAGRRPYQEEGLLALCRRVLGAQPVPSVRDHAPVSEELADLIHRCLDKDPARRPTAAEVATELWAMLERKTAGALDLPPFRGLLPFTEEHQHLFFGREAETGAFLEQLRQHPLVAVVGPSGAGKSSFVQAGVIPRLRERGPLVVVSVRPGRKPLDSLTVRIVAARRAPSDSTGGRAVFGTRTAWDESTPRRQPVSTGLRIPDSPQELAEFLREAPSRLNLLLHDLAERHRASVVLLVDQLEELYAVAEDPADRRAFMEALGTAADDPQSPVRIVLTLREEFLGRLAEGPGGRAALRQILVLRAPGADTLAQTLQRPVEARGYRFEDPRLAADMVAEVAGESAALPLLQFAAQSLWEERDRESRQLLRRKYEAMGGVAGALAGHADGVLAGLTPAQIELVRGLLLRLVTSAGTRRALSRAQVLEGLPAEASSIVDGLLDSRLLTARRLPGSSAVEIELVHESLVAGWGQLRRWLEESREDLAFLEEVTQASEVWERRGRPPEEVWHADALRAAQRAVAGLTTEIPDVVRRFLDAGERRERRRLFRRRLRIILAVAGLASVAVAASVVALVLSRQKAEVDRQRTVAVQRRAESQREGARAALARGDVLAARAMLRSALEIGDSMTARVLWWRLSETPLLWSRTSGGRVDDAAFSVDGRALILAGDDGTVRFVDPRTRSILKVLRLPGDRGQAFALSPDGTHVAIGARSGTTYLWAIPAGKLVARVRAQSHRLAVAFSPDGRLVADGGSGTDLRIWRIADRRIVTRMPAPGYQVNSIAFRPDGRLVATGGTDRVIRLWELPSGALRRTLRGHTKPPVKLRFSPDGRSLLASDLAWRVRLWDLASGSSRWEVTGRGAELDPDGKLVAAAQPGRHRRVNFIEARTGRVRARSLGSACDWLENVVFSPGGRLLAGTGGGPCVQIWDLGLRERSAPSGGHRIRVNAASFDPTGRRIVSAGLDGTIRIWDVTTGRELRVLRGHARSVIQALFSPDGIWLGSGGSDGTVRIWDAAAGTQKRVLLGHGLYAGGVAFRPDGKVLASAGEDNTIRLWEVPSGRPLRVLRAPGSIIVGYSSLSFHPQGDLLAVGSRDGAIRVFDTRTGALAHDLRGHRREAFAVAFRPDGRVLASGGYDRTVRLWDLARGTARVLRGDRVPPVRRLAFHPDGRHLGAASADGAAYLYDLEDGGKTLRLDATPTDDPQGCQRIAFNRDGKLAVTASGDGSVRTWDVRTGRPVWRSVALLWTDGSAPRLLTHRGWESLSAQVPTFVRGGDWTRRAWAQAVAREAEQVEAVPAGSLLCVRRFDGAAEVWDRREDKRLRTVALPATTRVLALPGACLAHTRARKVIRFWPGPTRVLPWSNVTALARDGRGLLLVADGDVVTVSSGRLQPVASRRGRAAAGPPIRKRVGRGASAVLRPRQGKVELVLGFQDGTLLASGPDARTYLEETPPSAATHLIEGPGGLLFAAFAGGEVGIWDLEGGARLHLESLHGRVRFLVLKNRRLYAVTDLGDPLVWDLSPLYLPAPDLLAEVRRKVTVIWRDGRAVEADPP